MYVQDGIVFGSEPTEGLSVSACRYVGDGTFLVTFSTGETRLFDATCLFDMPAFEPLKDSAVLERFSVQDGVLTWLDGSIDIAPEGIYARSYEYELIEQ